MLTLTLNLFITCRKIFFAVALLAAQLACAQDAGIAQTVAEKSWITECKAQPLDSVLAAMAYTGYLRDCSLPQWDSETPCYYVFEGAHHNLLLIEAEIADHVFVFDSLGHMRRFAEPVAPHIIPIPNAPPRDDVRIPPEYTHYGIFGMPEWNIEELLPCLKNF